MVIYHYDRSGLYLSAGSARPDPAEGLGLDGTPKKWLMPANSTAIEPPKVEKGFVAVFNGSVWQAVEDHRNEICYDKITLRQVVIAELGPIPDALTKLVPADKFQKWNGSAWVTDNDALAAEMRQDRNYRLSACDWTALLDSPLTDAQKAAWTQYRSELREYPDGWYVGKPWPVAP